MKAGQISVETGQNGGTNDRDTSRARALLRRDVPVSRGTLQAGQGRGKRDSDVHSVPVTGKALGQWEEEGGALTKADCAPMARPRPWDDEFGEEARPVCPPCTGNCNQGRECVASRPVPTIGDVFFVWLGMHTAAITWTFVALILGGIWIHSGAAIWRGLVRWIA